MRQLTTARVREVLDYDPETGIFRWKIALRRGRVGVVAGSSSSGRCYIRIDKKDYLASRLAWMCIHGEWPPAEIDHRDGNPLNNRIANLRLATRRQNAQNRGAQSNNSNGAKGVYFNKRRGKWAARIHVNGKNKWIGHSYATKEAAATAYESASREHFGEFART